MAAKQLLQYAVNRMDESQAAKALEASGIQFLAGTEWTEFKDGALKNLSGQNVSAGIGQLTAVRVGDGGDAARRTAGNSGARLDERGRETGPSPQPQFMDDTGMSANHGATSGAKRLEMTQLGSGQTLTVEQSGPHGAIQRNAPVGTHVTPAAEQKHPTAAGMASAPVSVGGTAVTEEAKSRGVMAQPGFQVATVPNANVSAQGQTSPGPQGQPPSGEQLQGADLGGASVGSTPTGTGSTPTGQPSTGRIIGQTPPKGDDPGEPKGAAAGADAQQAESRPSPEVTAQPETAPDQPGQPGIETPRHTQPMGTPRPEFPKQQ